jgi:hypothetical protein
VAIVVGTPDHRRSFEERLADAGADLAVARARGSYLALDASETLSDFMVAGWPDPASFWRVISPLLRQAAPAGQPVRVFGEMVSLLWDAGLVSAAIEVEALWNEMGGQYPFSLLCAYGTGRRAPHLDMTGVQHPLRGQPVPRARTSPAARSLTYWLGAVPGGGYRARAWLCRALGTTGRSLVRLGLGTAAHWSPTVGAPEPRGVLRGQVPVGQRPCSLTFLLGSSCSWRAWRAPAAAAAALLAHDRELAGRLLAAGTSMGTFNCQQMVRRPH